MDENGQAPRPAIDGGVIDDRVIEARPDERRGGRGCERAEGPDRTDGAGVVADPLGDADDAATVVPLPRPGGTAGDLWAAYERVGDRLRRVAFRVLHDAHEAEDAVHDAFVSAHASLHRLRDPALLENWLVRIARNAASTRLRQRRRCRPDFRLVADETPEGWDLPRVVARFGSGEPPPDAVAALRAELDAIPEAWREAFQARVMRGRTIPEIAVEQGVTAACVKTRISRVSSRLRRSI